MNGYIFLIHGVMFPQVVKLLCPGAHAAICFTILKQAYYDSQRKLEEPQALAFLSITSHTLMTSRIKELRNRNEEDQPMDGMIEFIIHRGIKSNCPLKSLSNTCLIRGVCSQKHLYCPSGHNNVCSGHEFE